MANQLLYPKNTETRRKVSLDGLWKFKFDPKNKGVKENWKKSLKKAELMPVPTGFNDLYADKDKREFTGDIWYERELVVPVEWKEKDLDLRFGSVTHHATVYINGEKAGEHSGGYTPFNISIQDFVSFDRKNKVVIKVSNELDETTLPAGSTSKNLQGIPVASTTTDYFNYSGIQRSVYLVATPKESITDISLSYEVDYKKQKAKVFYQVDTTGENQVKLEVYDEMNRSITSAIGKNGFVNIEEVHLWQPQDSYLYIFKWSIVSKEELVDVYIDEAGIRVVEIRGQELLINGKPVYLKGYAKHEYSRLHGGGSNLAALKRDFELMKWNGANAFRTAQFPHDEEVYRMADREGFIVINELPAIGMASPKPNRFNPNLGKGVEPYFEKEGVQNQTFEHHQQMVQELIQRDKNHASVCVWSLMDEPDTNSAEFITYAEELINSAKKLDIQNRPFTVLFGASSLEENAELMDLVDLVAINEYAGWESLGGYEISDAEEKLATFLQRLEQYNKPVLITGYGSEALQGEMKLPSVQWSENYQNEVFEMQHRLFDEILNIQGEFVWSFIDYQIPEGLTAINGNNSGVFTSDRQPKTAAYVLKNRWSGKMLKESTQAFAFQSAMETH